MRRKSYDECIKVDTLVIKKLTAQKLKYVIVALSKRDPVNSKIRVLDRIKHLKIVNPVNTKLLRQLV